MSVVVKRSDLFPVGTVVKAFASQDNLHVGGRPSGTATTEATVDSGGKLTLTLAEGVFVLWASIGGEDRNLRLGTTAFTAPGTLHERIKALRESSGAAVPAL